MTSNSEVDQYIKRLVKGPSIFILKVWAIGIGYLAIDGKFDFILRPIGGINVKSVFNIVDNHLSGIDGIAMTWLGM